MIIIDKCFEKFLNNKDLIVVYYQNFVFVWVFNKQDVLISIFCNTKIFLNNIKRCVFTND
jgi:hypothetical protein